jgi:hypothetical protein
MESVSVRNVLEIDPKMRQSAESNGEPTLAMELSM